MYIIGHLPRLWDYLTLSGPQGIAGKATSKDVSSGAGTYAGEMGCRQPGRGVCETGAPRIVEKRAHGILTRNGELEATTCMSGEDRNLVVLDMSEDWNGGDKLDEIITL